MTISEIENLYINTLKEEITKAKLGLTMFDNNPNVREYFKEELKKYEDKLNQFMLNVIFLSK